MSATNDEQTAIITGGAGGIGAAVAYELARTGMYVLIADANDEAGQELVQDLKSSGYQGDYRKLDVTNEDSWADLISSTLDMPPVKVLVNGAGIAAWGADVESETLAGWNKMIAINQTGVWLGMRAVAPALRKSGGGSIINISSVLGTTGGYGEEIAYHASKGAVRIMSKSAAVHWAKEGIRVNSVHPGFITTPMSLDGLDKDHEEKIIRGTPMGRMGTPEEVASVIAFLAGGASTYMTGSEVYVDGGYTAI